MCEYPFTVRPLSIEEGGGYLIEFPDLPGCISDGETIEEAIRNGEEAKRDWIAAMREADRPIPPASVVLAETYSGKWQLRAPKSLHRRLAEYAKREGVSLNTFAVTLLAEGVGERRIQSSTLPQEIENTSRSGVQTSQRTKRTAARPERGLNTKLVEEVLQANAPRAMRPAEIRTAVQRDKGVAMAFTSIRHALGQLEQRRAVEPVDDGKSWRHHGAGTSGGQRG